MKDLKRMSFSVKIRGREISFHWSVLLLLFWSASNFSAPSYVIAGFITSVFIVVVHEYGHYFAAKKLGYEVYDIVIHFWGGYCSHEEAYYRREEIIISAAGIIFQTALAVISFAVFMILGRFSYFNFTMIEYVLIGKFIYYNLFLALFNLLPIPGFDGYSIWSNIEFIIFFKHLKFKIPRRKKFKVIKGRGKQLSREELASMREEFMEKIKRNLAEDED